MRRPPKGSLTEDEAIGDIKRRFIKHPLMQSKVKISAQQAAGSASLAWHRGVQEGKWEAILMLRELGHVRVAESLRKAFGMTEDGSLRL